MNIIAKISILFFTITILIPLELLTTLLEFLYQKLIEKDIATAIQLLEKLHQ